MKIAPVKTGFDFKVESEVLCPWTLENESNVLAMRHGRFITEPWISGDGRKANGIIGYFLNNKTVALIKMDQADPIVAGLYAEFTKRGVKPIEVEHLSATELNASGKFMKDLCLWLVAPGLVVFPEHWQPSEVAQKAIKAADSPLKEHLQGIVANLQAVSNGIKNTEKLFEQKPSLKASESPAIQ
jgi:hypothetical protein